MGYECYTGTAKHDVKIETLSRRAIEVDLQGSISLSLIGSSPVAVEEGEVVLAVRSSFVDAGLRPHPSALRLIHILVVTISWHFRQRMRAFVLLAACSFPGTNIDIALVAEVWHN